VESTTSNDKVIISKKAKEYSSVNVFTDTVIKEVNDNTPSEKLLKLKDAISSGNYNIPSENIADAIFGKQTK
jgi:anti-sigma28 factor (negative regulator of flagellin synthesis)